LRCRNYLRDQAFIYVIETRPPWIARNTWLRPKAKREFSITAISKTDLQPKRVRLNMARHVEIPLLDKVVQRIEEVYGLMKSSREFERVLPDLENFLEAEIANGKTDQERLTVDGLRYLNQFSSRRQVS
jgi:hypothetical protein